MKSWAVYMPLYAGDYLRDTTALTRAEHGTYCLSMMTYWSNGGPLSDQKFRAVLRDEFEIVSEFYKYDGHGFWHHKRIDEEIVKAKDRTEKARVKSLKGVAARGHIIHPRNEALNGHTVSEQDTQTDAEIDQALKGDSQ